MTGSYSSTRAKCTLLVPTPLVHRPNLCHLLVVITDPVNIPPPSVVVVPLNSHYSGCDESCVLDVGEHEFITHKSFLNFKESRVREVSKIENGLKQGIFKLRDDVSLDVLVKICDSFEKSGAMERAVKGIYKRFVRETEQKNLSSVI